ncbi:MAG TPA: CheR family methyltransferase [Thermoanaerobaculaceae bacterium]|nr:CheR family methyltransferase [Thermoanaerobaculaceae bacterium]
MSEPAALAELAGLIEETSGNVIPPDHYKFLGETAKRRAASLRLAGVAAYVGALARGELPGEWSRLLPHVTVKESYLFRHPQHFAALATTILPRLATARVARRSLAVWSAGCARGEEPATLAIALAECRELVGWDWRILATDVDEEALAAAGAATFGERAVADVPADLRARHLLRHGESYELAPALARRIEYRALNLVREPLALSPALFDLVFLRNVLIYFRPEVQRRVAAAVAGALAPDGYLFLGPAETLWQVASGLDAVDLGDCFCYRHAGAAAAAAPHRRPDAQRRPERPVAAATALRPTVHAPRTVVLEARGTQERLALAARHAAADRFDDAVELVDQALLADPSDAGVHALEGFLHDISGRSQMAVASYRAALFLDAGLFQVRLLLADALRRLGHEQRAALEYREVLAALGAGRAHEVEALAPLALPDRREALRRCREALRDGGSQDLAARPL